MTDLILPQIVLIIILSVLIGWNIYLQWQTLVFKKRLKSIFNGSGAKDLEGVISQQIKRIRQNETEIKDIKKFTLYLEQMGLSGIQKTAMQRFSPFKNTGSNQSFSLCLLDGRNHGVIISSLFTREGNRIYAKSVESGKSKYQLTHEEEKILREAVKK